MLFVSLHMTVGRKCNATHISYWWERSLLSVQMQLLWKQLPFRRNGIIPLFNISKLVHFIKELISYTLKYLPCPPHCLLTAEQRLILTLGWRGLICSCGASTPYYWHVNNGHWDGHSTHLNGEHQAAVWLLRFMWQVIVQVSTNSRQDYSPWAPLGNLCLSMVNLLPTSVSVLEAKRGQLVLFYLVCY